MFGSLYAGGLGGAGGGAAGKLQLLGGGVLSSSLVAIADAANTASKLKVSTTATQAEGVLYVGDGTITNNGVLNVKGAGGNIASFRDSSNLEVGSITSTGGPIFSGNGNIAGMAIQQTSIFSNVSSTNKIRFGAVTISVDDTGTGPYNNAAVVFAAIANNKGVLIPSMTSATFQGISAKPEGLFAYDTTERAFVLYSQSVNQTYRYGQTFLTGPAGAGSLASPAKVAFGSRGSVSLAGLTALGLTAQIVISSGGTDLYIPCSPTLIP